MHRPRPLIRPSALAGLVLLLSLTTAAAFAVPAAPNPFTLRQPDGTAFLARLWGDEHYHGHETADGYSILKDETTGYWHYAVADARGALLPGALLVGIDPPSGLTRGLRGVPPPREQLDRTTQANEVGGNVVPSAGVAHVPVLLVNFSNTTWTQAATSFGTLLFGGGTYSMADYYKEVSYGRFTVDAGASGVGGWYTAPNTHDYYGTNGAGGSDSWPGDLVYEAAAAADAAGYDFAPYDQDGDCYVDNIMIVHQGGGEEFGGAPATNIWSHSWDLNSARFFNNSHYGAYTTNSTCPANPATKVKVNKYTIQPELYGTTARITTIGVFSHEFGHALGLPDLYDTDGSSEGVGNWSLMAGGSWGYYGGDQGNRPSHLDPWSKWKLGWILPRAASCSTTASLPAVEASSAGFYALLKGGLPYTASGEYFLVENRQKGTTTFDAGLPGAGMLIWHVDEAVAGNQNECYPGATLPCNGSRHYKVSVLQADNAWNLEKKNNRGDAGDPYPGTSGRTTFDGSSTPGSNTFAGAPDGGTASGVSVTSISASAATMTATLAAPGPCITSFTPTSGPVATAVAVSGSGFTGAASFLFNGTNAAFTVGSDSSLSTSVPSGATTGPLSLANASIKVDSSASFSVSTLPTPAITSFTPTSGPVGTSVTIAGSNLTGATQVRFNTTGATSYTVNSATQITATVPAGATTGAISVTTPGGTAASSASFIVGTAADVAVTASGPYYATRGGSLAYTIRVTNNGPATASAVQIDLTVPGGIIFVANAGDCTTAFPCSFATLASGVTRIITTTLGVPVGHTPAPLRVTASATASTADPDANNNTATATTRFGSFFTLAPCRVADTRTATSPNGPPPLAPGGDRTLTLAGTCGIPPGATALAVNVTVTGGTASGDLRLFPADVATIPLVSTINFAAGQTRANNAIVVASGDGNASITVHNDSSATVDLIMDVTGYFE